MYKHAFHNPSEGIAVVSKGMEEFAARELTSLGFTPSIIGNSHVRFTLHDEKTLLACAYFGHSWSRLLLSLAQGKHITDAGTCIEQMPFYNEKHTIAIIIESVHPSEKNSEELRAEIQDAIAQHCNKTGMQPPRFVYNNADITLCFIIDKNQWVAGIDAFERDLSKRLYKVFLHRASLKAHIAYAVLSLCDYTGKKTLVDPFCGSGIIPIEGALVAHHFPLYHFDKHKLVERGIYHTESAIKTLEAFDEHIITKASPSIYAYDSMMGSVRITQKNAKIAGIEKSITARRVSLDWVDLKIDPQTIDCIATDPPRVNRACSEDDLRKMLRLLFSQAQIILKKQGTVCIITTHSHLTAESAQEKSFTLREERTVYSGKEPLQIMLFSRKEQS